MDTNIIPSTGRSPAAMAYHIDLWKRSEDIWRVYNPTEQDYVIHFDRMRSNQRWVVPNKNKDIGHGKGIQEVPQYAMVLYREAMGTAIILEKSKKLWDKDKGNYRIEDRSKMEENSALRSNNPQEWDEIIPILIKGIVKRFGVDEFPEDEPLESPQTGSMSMGEAAMARLKMTDMDAGLHNDEEKKIFIESIT